LGMPALLPQAQALSEALDEPDFVDVAVFGRFKAGKSSLLNSLVGRDVLPADVLPATSVITRLRHGSSERATLQQLDGRTVEVPPTSLAEYVTEGGNPGNARGIARVDVELPALAAYPGLRFVDTPGSGSVYEAGTRVSRDWLPRTGVALVAVSCEQPLGEDDVALLRRLSALTPEIVVVLTKADLLDQTQLARVEAFVRSRLDEQVRAGLPVLPFSVRDAEGRLGRGLRDLLRGLVDDRRGETRARILAHKSAALLTGCAGYLKLALGAATADAAARQRFIAALRREEEARGAVIGEIAAVCTVLKGRLRSQAEEIAKGRRSELQARLQADLADRMPRWRGRTRTLEQEFLRWLGEALRRELLALSPDFAAVAAGFTRNAEESCWRSGQAFQDRLSGHAADSLGLAFRGVPFTAVLAAPSRPDIRVTPAFDTSFRLLSPLVWTSLFRPLITGHFRRLLPWEVDKNLHRLAVQWSEAGGAAIDEVAGQLDRFLGDELRALERLVAGAADRREELGRALAEIEAAAGDDDGPVAP